MSYALVGGAAFLAALATFFSGFGLGTLLLPVFLLFLPAEVAVAATAIVHLANNLFKAVLVGRNADWRVAVRFCVPAVILSGMGALLLVRLSTLSPIANYSIFGRTFSITLIKVVIAALLAFFSMMEVSSRLAKVSFSARFIPLGGALSGFFGGLSGHQGAFRSAFLLRAGLSKEVFIGTGILCALAVDFARLSVYAATFLVRGLSSLKSDGEVGLIAVGCVCAFLGSLLGARLLPQVTLRTIRILVGFLLFGIALALAAGWI